MLTYPVCAQPSDPQAPDALKSATPQSTEQEPKTQPAAAPAAKTKPSRDDLKKCMEFGFRAQMIKGKLQFCRNDAETGTRISSYRCMDENLFDDYVTQMRFARDNKNLAGGTLCQRKY